MNYKLILSELHTEQEEKNTKLVCNLNSDFWGENNLWFSVPSEYQNLFNSSSYDAFLVGLLYPAMKHNFDIEIKGAVSKKLFKNINSYVQAILCDYDDELSKIQITTETLVSDENKGKIVGTGFSAGIDSFCTFYERFEKEEDVDYKVNTLFFFNVGSHGPYGKENVVQKFNIRYDYLKKYTDSKNLPFIPVDSNLHLFHKEFGHQKTHPISLCSGVLAFSNSIKKYYISSALSYKNAKLFGANQFGFDLSEFSETYLLPLLSTENCELVSDGCQHTRSEKTAIVSEYKDAQKILNVCVNEGTAEAKNCSICPKCKRTLFTLESIGKIDLFSNVFELNKWKKARFLYKCEQRVLYKKDPFAKDNVDCAIKNGKKVPSYFVSFIVTLPKNIIRLLKTIVRKILGKEKTTKLKQFLRRGQK